MLDPINDADTETQLAAERAFLAGLDGSCRTPIAGLAELDGDQIRFRGEVIRPDGSECLTVEHTGPASDAATIGAQSAQELRAQGGMDFFAT